MAILISTPLEMEAPKLSIQTVIVLKGADHSMQIEFYDGFIYFEDENVEDSRRILAIDEILSNTILGYKILYTESNALQLSSYTISCGMAWDELERFIR